MSESRRCTYCGTTENLTIDHKIPRTRGGTDDPENLTPACRRCNSRKKDRTPEELLAGLSAGMLDPPIPPPWRFEPEQPVRVIQMPLDF